MTDDIYKKSLDMHEKNKGKLEVKSIVKLETREDLSLAYTPGVAEACRQIAKDKSLAYKYTLKSRTIAVVSDGSAVLGLGNIGGYAAIPVMEGKAILFKELGDVDAFPICFEDYKTDIVDAVKKIAPVFGGINLEDIAAPKCFEVEEELQNIGIPVMHDDQHGTAIVVLAALMNACKVSGKKFSDLRVVINGAGSAGLAIARLLTCAGINPNICESVKEIIVVDTKGAIYNGREDLKNNKYKQMIAERTNFKRINGTLADTLKGADVFIGVSVANALNPTWIKNMNPKPIIFALANPVPEIMPDVAKNSGAFIVGTGRSDFPNQINNALAFPGVFRGALDAHASKISNEMKIAAAHALANYVQNPSIDLILPPVLDKKVALTIAKAVNHEARKSGDVRLS